MSPVRTVAWGLTLAGLIPFVGCAALFVLSPQSGDLWVLPLAAYGAIILSFLGGARWGRALAEPAPKVAPLILSNLPAVAAWLTFVPGVPQALQLIVLMAGLVAMLAWDWPSAPGWYRALRVTATVGAVASLGVVLAAL
ncbi:hypothetical protein BZG35_17420 [Brevundimonas sp. LM2]|uniref:DUF3429 domain-containing protein n=1 Tax=Brevundimonas sp. LM2 TaxID=1938605 RepID=UPI000983F3B0|nr:DUF3429 domain-containing protein [Brevundimonas sp. LM2]AQR63228.1 hypothetical protein BZG35_17420 [Brevundimonas sp. LM2]